MSWDNKEEIKLITVLTKAAFIKTTFHQESGLKFKEETIVLLFDHSFLRCGNLYTSESRSKTP